MVSREEYIENILDHHDSPRNRRRIDHAHIQGSGGNPGCGDVVIIFMRLDERGTVTDASFEGEGCTISQAGASMLTDSLIGKTPEEVLLMTFEAVVEEMGRDVVSSRTRCATLALSTAKGATNTFLSKRRVAGSMTSS